MIDRPIDPSGPAAWNSASERSSSSPKARRLLPGYAFVPKRRPRLAGGFSPWKALKKVCVPSGRGPGGNGFQGLKSMANLGRPSGTKATPENVGNVKRFTLG
jgi:hypothetical protein